MYTYNKYVVTFLSNVISVDIVTLGKKLFHFLLGVCLNFFSRSAPFMQYMSNFTPLFPWFRRHLSETESGHFLARALKETHSERRWPSTPLIIVPSILPNLISYPIWSKWRFGVSDLVIWTKLRTKCHPFSAKPNPIPFMWVRVGWTSIVSYFDMKYSDLSRKLFTDLFLPLGVG